MKVCVDARMIGSAGIGRFIDGLLRGLIETAADVAVLPPSGDLARWLPNGQLRPSSILGPRLRPYGLLEQLALPWILRRNMVDVHHSPHLTVPYLTTVPVVLTVHDVFPLKRMSNARSAAARWYYRAAFPRAAGKASAIVAPSNYAAEEAREYLGIPDGRIHVVEHGFDHDHWRNPGDERTEADLKELGLVRPYLLYVGTTKSHKNLPTLLRALTDEMPPLVMVGPTVAHLTAAAPGVSTRQVKALGRVPERFLPSVYAAAEALVLPSLYEGVGFPALEAMGCGTAVIASSGGGLPEAVGDAAVLVPPTDIAAWTAAITNLLGDPQQRASLVRAGHVRVAARNWRKCAEGYLAVYRGVLS